MTTTVIKGQKVQLTRANQSLQTVRIGLGWQQAQAGIDLDASAFLLGANGKVIREEDFVFYGNPNAAQGAVIHSGDHRVGGGAADNEQIQIHLSRLSHEIERIAFTITIYDAVARKQNFSQVKGGYLRVVDEANGVELLHFQLGTFTVENAVVVGELYRHRGAWKFNAIGAGFEGGLASLCANFGVEVNDTPPPPKTIKPTPAPTSQSINLAKIELKKKGDVISLRKTNKQLGQILINLNWNQQGGFSKGLFNRGSQGKVDLDLGCLIEMKDGGKTAIQALGENFGDYGDYPFIELDGDDRTGAVSTGENIRINGNYVYEFKRILVYAFIYDGVANWSQVDGVVTVKQEDNPEIVVRLDSHENRKNMCAIALIENDDDQTFSIQKVVQYFNGHREMDRAFKWGLRWQSGSKD